MADDKNKLFGTEQGEAGEVFGNPEETVEEQRQQADEEAQAELANRARKLAEEPEIDTEPAIDNDDLGIFGK